MFIESEFLTLIKVFARNPRIDRRWIAASFGDRLFGTIGGGEIRTSEPLEFFVWMLYAASFRWNCYAGPRRILLRELMAVLHLILEFPGNFVGTFLPGAKRSGIPQVTKIWWVVADICQKLLVEFPEAKETPILEAKHFVSKFTVEIGIEGRETN